MADTSEPSTAPALPLPLPPRASRAVPCRAVHACPDHRLRGWLADVDGVISPQEALAFFSKSGLPKPILSGVSHAAFSHRPPPSALWLLIARCVVPEQIWKKCARGGQMDTGQFDIAMDLVHHERREAKRLAEEGGAPAAPPAVSAPSGTNALVPQPAAPDPREAAAAAERELQRQRAAAAAAEQAAAAERAARLAAEQEVARQAEEARLAAEAEAEAAAAAAAAAATAHLHHTGGSPVPVMPASAPPVDDFFGGIDAGRSASGFEDAFAATPASAAALSQVIPAAAAAGHDEGFEVDFDDFGVEPVPSPAPAPFQQPPAPFDPAAGGGYAQPAELASLTATTASVEHALGDDHATPEERMRGDAPVDGTAMAFAVPYDDTLGPTSGIGVVVPLEDDNSMTARFNVVWIKEHDGGVQLPTTLDVSIEGVRAIATKENGDEICIFFSDYYHIKSWDVATQKFGLKLMEQPPRGGGSVELSFFFLTQEARMIAGAVKAQVDQLILEKQNGKHTHTVPTTT